MGLFRLSVVDRPHREPAGAVAAIPFRGIDGAQVRAVGQSPVGDQAHVLPDAPEQVGPAAARQGPQREAEELAVRQAQHAGLQPAEHSFGERDLARPIARHLAGKQHMRTVLHQRDEAQLREGAAAPAGAGPTERRSVRRLVGNVEGAAVQAHQTPSPIPRPPGHPIRNRLHHRAMQTVQRLPAKTRARLRDPRLAGHLKRVRRTGQPLNPLQQAAQNLAVGRLHVERKRDYVIHHHRRRKRTPALARPPGIPQNRLHRIKRKRLRDHTQTDVVGDTRTRRESPNST